MTVFSDSFCLVSVLRSPFPLRIQMRHLPPTGELAGRGSSETEGNFQVASLHIEADMLLKGRRNEPAIRLGT